MSDVFPLSGVSGLSFDSPLLILSPVCLVLLPSPLALPVLSFSQPIAFMAMGRENDKTHKHFSLRETFLYSLVERLRDDSW